MHLHKLLGELHVRFCVKNIVLPPAKRLGADLLEFAVSKYENVVCGRKNFKTAARSLGRQTLRKQMDIGSRNKKASRVISPKSAKQTSWSRNEIFTNLPH